MEYQLSPGKDILAPAYHDDNEGSSKKRTQMLLLGV